MNSLAELKTLGLDFVSLRDNLDLGTPAGRLIFQIIGAMAEFERSLIQKRVRAGLRNAKHKSRRLGRPPAVVDAQRKFDVIVVNVKHLYFENRMRMANAALLSMKSPEGLPARPDRVRGPRSAQSIRRDLLFPTVLAGGFLVAASLVE